MHFHSSIYRTLEQANPEAAKHFLRDFNTYRDNRRLFSINDFELVTSYFFTIFNVDPGKYAHPLRCISGNRTRVHWVEDFKTVIMPCYIENYPTFGISSKRTSEMLVSELGMLLGTT